MESIEDQIDLSTSITSLSYKFNIENDDIIAPTISDIISYTDSISNGKKYCTIGKHTSGINEQPHVHVNIIVEEFQKTKNESRRRSNWFKSNDLDLIEGLSLKTSGVNDIEKFTKCMQYPYKEGKLIELPKHFKNKFEEFTSEQVQYLQESAKALYQIKLDNDRKKKRSSDKTNNLMQEVLQLLGDKQFTNYQSYKEYIYDAYFKDLEIEEYPELNNLQKSIQKVSIFRKIVPPYYFDKTT